MDEQLISLIRHLYYQFYQLNQLLKNTRQVDLQLISLIRLIRHLFYQLNQSNQL